MKTLVVEKSKIRANLETVKERAGKAQVIAVLKANAYGMNAVVIAETLKREGASFSYLTVEALHQAYPV